VEEGTRRRGRMRERDGDGQRKEEKGKGGSREEDIRRRRRKFQGGLFEGGKLPLLAPAVLYYTLVYSSREMSLLEYCDYYYFNTIKYITSS
jgi:hypothetical protein